MQHPEPERLQGYAEGAIAECDSAAVASHLAVCDRCAADVQEWRMLFATLADLPQFSPGPAFANRVMARVELPAPVPVWAPWLQRARGLAERIAPRTTRGWALAAAMLALPLILGSGLLAWLFSREYITPDTLWALVTDRASSSLQSLGADALGALMETQLMTWLVQEAGAIVAHAGLRGLGLAAAVGAALTMLSIWILYKNLFRTPTRETNHVSYSF